MNELKKLLENAGIRDRGHNIPIDVMISEIQNKDYDGFWEMFHNEGGMDEIKAKLGNDVADEIWFNSRHFTPEAAAEKALHHLMAGSNESGMTEANPDGTIGDDEGERVAELMATFESELDDLIGWATKTASEIGGEFRAPGIMQSIRSTLQQKQSDLRKKPEIEYLTPVDAEDDPSYGPADPTGTLKRDIDGNIGPTK